MTTAAYEEGYTAGWDGSARNQNPHPESSDEFGDWMDGHKAAQREMEQECYCAEVDRVEYASIYD